MQNLIMSNPKRAIWFMTSMKPDFWEKQGENLALKTFHEAAEKVPAYKDFISKHGIKDHTKIKTIDDFKKYVPLMDKDNYLRAYPLEKLVIGKIEESYTLYMSGGTTGDPTYYLVPREEFKVLPFGMVAIYDYLWDITSKKTLFINGMALGVWMAGVIANFLLKTLCDKYKNFTVVTPGADYERILDILEKIGRNYDLIFIGCYPTLLKTLLDTGKQRGIDWKKYNIKVNMGGEPFDDNLRDYILNKINPTTEGFWAISEGYGGTEFGYPGLATPLTIEIRKIARRNEELCLEIFKNKIPLGLYQWNPAQQLVESINDTLYITRGGKIPLIRYTPKDMGNLFSWEEMNQILVKNKINIFQQLEKDGWVKPNFQWPFMTFLGRKDYSISLYGAKISPQMIQYVLGENPLTHSFKISGREEKNLKLSFDVFIELQKNVKISEEEKQRIEAEYSKKILDYLLKTNFDFKDAYSIHKEALTPKVKVYSFREGPFQEEKDRIKPRFII